MGFGCCEEKAAKNMVTEHATETHEEAAMDRVGFGFWVYLMTDLLMFAVLFAVFAVLRDATHGGPSGQELFKLPFVLTETLILLTSSFTAGIGMLAAHRGNKSQVLTWFGVTFCLGLAFLGMELYEFAEFIHEDHTWQSNASLSAFFTLVGTHGLHITSGLLWMGTALVFIWKRGLNAPLVRKLTLLSLFWHFLDIVWIFIFTVVYLMAFV
jgi:cytochrome o ubiquinol oxidase subunit 3